MTARRPRPCRCSASSNGRTIRLPYRLTTWVLGSCWAPKPIRASIPARLLGCFQTAMRSLVEDLEESSHKPALSLPVLPDDERRKVIQSFNPAAVPYPQDRLVHELFEEQAARTPTACAVKTAAGSLTFSELNNCANSLAQSLGIAA